MNEFKVREDFANQKEYENYKSELFLAEIPLFLVKLKNITLIDYASIMTSIINIKDEVKTSQFQYEDITDSGRTRIPKLGKFFKIGLCHEELKEIWLTMVYQKIFSLFGNDVFLAKDIIKGSRWLEQEAVLLFDNAYIAYLIKEFGIAQDVSDKEQVFAAYEQAIISNDKQSQKPLSKKLIQQLVKQEQNAVQNGTPLLVNLHGRGEAPW